MSGVILCENVYEKFEGLWHTWNTGDAEYGWTGNVEGFEDVSRTVGVNDRNTTRGMSRGADPDQRWKLVLDFHLVLHLFLMLLGNATQYNIM